MLPITVMADAADISSRYSQDSSLCLVCVMIELPSRGAGSLQVLLSSGNSDSQGIKRYLPTLGTLELFGASTFQN